MTLDLRPEIAQGLEALASAQGLSVEDYLQRHVARELPTMADAGHATRQRLSSTNGNTNSSSGLTVFKRTSYPG